MSKRRYYAKYESSVFQNHRLYLKQVRSLISFIRNLLLYCSGTTGRNFYMLLSGSVYIMARSAVDKVIARDRAQKLKTLKKSGKHVSIKKNEDPTSISPANRGQNIAYILQLIMSILNKIDSIKKMNEKLSQLSPQKEAVIKLLDMKEQVVNNSASPDANPDEENDEVADLPLPPVTKNEEDIYSKSDLFATYPSFSLLATLHAPSYFGEIALNTQQPRYLTEL